MGLRVPDSLLLFPRSALIDLALASFSCSHCFLLVPWLCSHCWDFCVFQSCPLLKLIPAYFLPSCFCLLSSFWLLPFFRTHYSVTCLLFLPPEIHPRSPICSSTAQMLTVCFPRQLSGAAVSHSGRRLLLGLETAALLQLEEHNWRCYLTW